MLPAVPGISDVKCTIRHSTAHDSSRDFVDKEVCVVGSSSSDFDDSYNCAPRGIDVTLPQRSPTYMISLTHSVPRVIDNHGPDAEQNRPSLGEQDHMGVSD
ncbi:hypothetical protein FPOAC2_03812 [Fusarium poae]